MTTITLSAPAPGLNKVRLTKALCAELGLSLSEAKRVTDRVADGHAVDVPVADRSAAERMVGAAHVVGAVAVVNRSVAARPLAG